MQNDNQLERRGERKREKDPLVGLKETEDDRGKPLGE